MTKGHCTYRIVLRNSEYVRKFERQRAKNEMLAYQKCVAFVLVYFQPTWHT
jgi:hypothetical protein